MRLRTRLAVLVCKASGAVLRKLGRGGTNLPGKLALKIDKNILGELSRGVKVTVVTGTNGKTTTSRMIEQAFADAGLRYFSNKSGANLLTGIIAVFAQHATLSGRCPYTHALIECDEAAFRRTSEYLPVECLVVNNIFRDQLDRYGEITHTLNAIREGITHVPNATLCLNADCSLTASLAEDGIPNPVIRFGVNVPIYSETAHELSDAVYCIHCKTQYEYDYRTYGHLGGFRCPKCGYHRIAPEVAVTQVISTGADASDIVLDIFGHAHEVHVNLPGGYNIYNAAAAAAAAHVVGIDEKTTVSALGQFECGFGRAEQFRLGQAQARMMLVKNPAGYNQVINLISHDVGSCKLAFLLNDRFADGTDISWIWDVDFEALAAQQSRFTRIFVSGVRADDMALRLKYAGFPAERIELVRDAQNADGGDAGGGEVLRHIVGTRGAGDASRGGSEFARDKFKERRFAGAVVAHDGGFGARGDGQVYSFEQKLLIAVAVRNTAKDNTHMKTINSGPAEKGPVKPQTGLLYGTASV